MKYGLIGEKLGHSFSKDIHERLGGYEYELREIAPNKLDEFMKKKDFLGINVTIPYKERVIPYLDFIDERAKEIGAVNTVVNRDGKLYGYNTDYDGMMALFAHAGIDPKGRKAVILGSGGTSKTAMAVLKELGAGEIIRLSRSGKDGAETYGKNSERYIAPDLVVNTTPVGMYPECFDMPVIFLCFESTPDVIDVIYNPLRPMSVMEARANGAKAEGGLYMLVAQAIRASEVFLGKSYPKETVEKLYKDILHQKENIVLIGMPASGKTTVGRMLAERLGRRFIDTDEEIVRMTGRSIKDIFEDEGECIFRAMEREVIQKYATESSLVIATGGGAVLKRRNMDVLRLNGRLFFIDRPLESLVPTESRPLSNDKRSIKKRYNERYSLYIKNCDVRIDADCNAEEVVRRILESLK